MEASASHTVAPPASSPRARILGLALLAVLGHLALLDAALETFWSGSPLRWRIVLVALALVAFSLWIWRPGGKLLRRFGPGGAATTAVAGLLALLAATAWLPGGQSDGVRLLLQRTPTVLTLATIAAVLLATFVIFQVLLLAPSRARSVARAVFILLGAYAVLALVVALREHTTYSALFQGNAVWSRLPARLQGPFIGVFGLVPLAIVALFVRFAAQRHQSLQVLGRQALALVLAFAMSLAGVSIPQAVPTAQQGTPAVTWRPRADQLGSMFRALDHAVKNLDRTPFDPRAVVDKVGRNADGLFEWVRDNTYWVPYRGALRGPVGVLMDRTGNSIDRALLLAELLQLAGQTVRLARAELPPATAEESLARIRRPPAGPRPQPVMTDEALTKMDATAGGFGLNPRDLRQALLAMRTASERLADDAARRATEQTRAVLAKLDRPAEDDSASGARAAIADHWWVQRLDNDTWSDMDPLLPDARPGLALVAPEETILLPEPDGKVHVDSKYCQEVDLRVVAEQRRGGALTEHQALEYTLRPSNLFGQAVSLQHEPLNWPTALDLSKESDPLGRLRAEAARQTEWIPILSVGPTQIEGSVIDATGRVKARAAAGPGGAGSPMGGFGGLLGGAEEGEDTADGTLTAEWIDYSIRVPGAEPRTIRRPLFDLIGPAARAAAKNSAIPPVAGLPRQRTEERALAILDRVDVLVQVSKYAPEYVLDLGARHVLAQQSSILNLAGRGKPTREEAREALDALMPESATLLNLAVARFTQRFGSPAVYLDCPNILNWRSGFRFEATTGPVLQEFFDLVDNSAASLPDAWSKPLGDSQWARAAFETQVRQGVVDTVLEGTLLTDARARYSASAFFAAASEQGIGTATVLAGDLAGLARIGLPPDAACFAAANLSDGYHLVLPARAVTVDGAPRFCWWRVNARTGETVGVLDTGFYQGEEYAQTVRVSAARAVYRQASKKAAQWVAGRGIQFYNGWTAPPLMGSLCWDWSQVAIFGGFGIGLVGGIGAWVWALSGD